MTRQPSRIAASTDEYGGSSASPAMCLSRPVPSKSDHAPIGLSGLELAA